MNSENDFFTYLPNDAERQLNAKAKKASRWRQAEFRRWTKNDPHKQQRLSDDRAIDDDALWNNYEDQNEFREVPFKEFAAKGWEFDRTIELRHVPQLMSHTGSSGTLVFDLGHE